MSPTEPTTEPLRWQPEVLSECFPGRPAVKDLRPLAGDASTRSYYRVTLDPVPGAPATVLVMQLDPRQPDTGLDWLEIQRYLAGCGLPVPAVYGGDSWAGLIFLEDLGDDTLETRLRKGGDGEQERWYDAAVDLLAEVQVRAVAPEGPAFQRRFDEPKLMAEFDFMLEQYAGGLLGLPLDDETRRSARAATARACRTLAGLETGFAHRDFHSRNLMVSGGRLVMIDFQDARLGPCQYDLVSLLRDSYVRLPEALVSEKKERFLRRKEALEGRRIDREAFDSAFDLMSVQRNLKAVGTFAFQARERGNPRYLPYIEPTLDLARRTLTRRAEFKDLKEALEGVLPPLRTPGGSA